MVKLLEKKLKIFYRKTKRGNITKVVREHYLRDDIYCGLKCCELCEGKKVLTEISKSNSTLFKQPHHLLVDTNVALHQIDLLSQEAITNVILVQTVLHEVRHKSLDVYKRLRDLIDDPSKSFYVFNNEHHRDCYVERENDESANDRNDRAIRTAAWWYNQHFALFKQNVILLTDDAENLIQARKMDVQSFTTRDYIMSRTNEPGLLDLLAQNDTGGSEDRDFQKFSFPPHWSMDEIRKGLKSGKLRQGTMKASQSNYLEGNVLVDGDSVLIQGRTNLNRALNEDVVAIEILPKSEWVAPSTELLEQEEEEEEMAVESATDEVVVKVENDKLEASKGKGETQVTARVVGIIGRKWRQYCGILKKNEFVNSNRHLFLPSDKKIPFIRIETRQAGLLYNKRILVAIDSWPRDSIQPKGHFVKVIGDIGDKETENEVILLEHDCPHSKFSESVLNCLPKLPWSIAAKDEEEREDFRHLNICSVDPVGCQDIDDALHCKQLPNGNYEVGVHIADVTHFIRPNTSLDKEAQNRSTAVYLTTRRIDMVPVLLSTNLCSLRSNNDRFAFSVIWELDSKGRIISSRFAKSIIHSRAELTYQEAQQRIDDPSLKDDLTKSLRTLNNMAKHMKQRRQDAGALVLASMEVKFHLDPDNDTVVDIIAKQHLETMSMVEEFMLLANVTVAETIVKHFPDCALLRSHAAPPKSNFDKLLTAAKSQGVEIDVTSNKTLSDSLNKATKEDNPFFNSMLRIMATRCMMQAVYFCASSQEKAEFYHYGLATPCYTHFTSPIRRYADIIVHRLLAVIIEKEDTYPDLMDTKVCNELAKHINYRHRMAQYAGRASVTITANATLRGKVNEYEANILFLHKNAVQVLIPTIGQQATLYVNTHIKDQEKRKKEYLRNKRMGKPCEEPMDLDVQLPEFTFDEQELVLKCGDVEFRPFDRLIIQLSVDSTDVQHEKVVTRLVYPKIEGFSVPSIKEDVKPPKNKKKKTK